MCYVGRYRSVHPARRTIEPRWQVSVSQVVPHQGEMDLNAANDAGSSLIAHSERLLACPIS